MPNTYRHARIIFPGLLTHPLLGTFQPSDRGYIVPEGAPIFVPIDASLYDEDIDYIDMLFAIPPDSGLRLRRIHMWIEPDSLYPRGTKFTLTMYDGTVTFSSSIFVYSGMYYIIPFDITLVEQEAESLVNVTHYADQAIHEGNYTEFFLRLKDGTGGDLPSDYQPILYMLAELR